MPKKPRGEQRPTTPANSSQQPQNVKEVPLGLNKQGNQKKR